MKLLLLLVVVMSLKSANGCTSSTMNKIDCALFSKNCIARDLAYENLRHYNEDSEPMNNDEALNVR